MPNLIPNIAFKKKENKTLEFEIFPLKKLYAREGKMSHSIQTPHRVKFYNILYIKEGHGKHTIDFKDYEFSPGSLLFISQNQVQAFHIKDDVDGFIILFTEKFFSKNLINSDIISFYRLYNYHLHIPLLEPKETSNEIFNHIIYEIYREYNYPNQFVKEEILRHLLKLLLLKAERTKRTIIPQEKNIEWLRIFNKFQRLVEGNITQTRNAKDFANSLGLSYKHLNVICKSITQSTAKEFIDNYLILETKRQLATHNLSVKELAYELGFDEPTNFIKFFKKHTKFTPAQFKAQLK